MLTSAAAPGHERDLIDESSHKVTRQTTILLKALFGEGYQCRQDDASRADRQECRSSPPGSFCAPAWAAGMLTSLSGDACRIDTELVA